MNGPTQGATELEERTWQGSPWAARSVRAAALILPFVVAWFAVYLVSGRFYRPGRPVGLILWLAQAMTVSMVVSLAIERVTRRLLPLATLLNMTLVFPDQAPSRFSIALKSGTVRKLEERVEHVCRHGLSDADADAAEQAVELIGLLGQHDRLTRGHTERVRAYADMIAEELGVSAPDRHRLAWGAMLHDIGKLAVPPEVLNKDGRPSEEEWRILQGHPAASAELLVPLQGWLGEWGLAAAQHHERWDGNGYPAGLAGSEISLAGRITAVADAYDVITSRRSYKKPMSPEAAREELIRCAGTQFDPDVVRAFLNVSLGRRWVAGPLASILELPGVINIGTNLPAASTVVAGAMVAAGSTVLPTAWSPPPAEDLAYVETTVVDGQEPEPVTTVSIGPSGTGPTSVPLGAVDRPQPTAVDDSLGPTEESGSPEIDTTSATTDAGQSSSGGDPPSEGSAQTTTTLWSGPSGTGQPPTTTSTSSGTTTKATTTTTSATTTTASASTTTTTLPATTTTTTMAPTTTTTAATTTTTTWDGPIAVADSVSVDDKKDIRIHVIDNDLDGLNPIDDGTLTITVDPLNANDFRVHGDHLHYKSEKDFDGIDTLEYEICDTAGLCDRVTVTITVTA